MASELHALGRQWTDLHSLMVALVFLKKINRCFAVGTRKLVRKPAYRHETRAVLATSTVAAASEMSKANTSNIRYGYVDG